MLLTRDTLNADKLGDVVSSTRSFLGQWNTLGFSAHAGNVFLYRNLKECYREESFILAHSFRSPSKQGRHSLEQHPSMAKGAGREVDHSTGPESRMWFSHGVGLQLSPGLAYPETLDAIS